MRLLAACVAVFSILGGVASSLQIAPGASPRLGLYDANPNHLWNRLHESLQVRVAPQTRLAYKGLFQNSNFRPLISYI